MSVIKLLRGTQRHTLARLPCPEDDIGTPTRPYLKTLARIFLTAPARRLGYDHLATTTRYGDTCCASCGSIDTARLVAGTGHLRQGGGGLVEGGRNRLLKEPALSGTEFPKPPWRTRYYMVQRATWVLKNPGTSQEINVTSVLAARESPGAWNKL